MTAGVRAALLTWIAGLLGCLVIVSHTRFTADMSAFLPRTPTPEQKVLVDQLKDGAVSRLVLVGIEGADAPVRAALSIKMAAHLRTAPELAAINNGASAETAKDRDFLLANRYLLSAAVTPEQFSEAGLRAAIAESIDLLASPAGMMLKSILPRDPTGELLRLVQALDGGARPAESNGAWASQDGTRAILLAQTRAAGSDIDGQQAALGAIRTAFAQASADVGASASPATLLMTGSGVFAVESRARIQREVLRLALWSAALITGLLLIIYRSVTALALGLLPVASGALAGVAAVSLGFGEVHGLTLGFGTTLIGEAVDYSIYLFIQSERGSDPAAGPAEQRWVESFWPTVRLGVLTSICGFAALLASGFPGLAQLGLYSITGLIVAAAVTRFVLPTLLPKNFRVRDVSALGAGVAVLVQRAGALRWAVAALVVGACVVLALHRDTLWNNELGGLSPITDADQARDQRLRADLGAPDARYLLVATGADADAALAAAERVAGAMQPLVAQRVLGGFESPARFLPSTATQKARQDALPARDELLARLRAATVDLPLRAERLLPFVDDVEAARRRPLLTRADLDGTSLLRAVDALLMRQGDGRWSAMLPLRAPAAGAIDAGRIRAA
ncbi:MAG: MMPL family transporter, partial [Betaproteobacteria bacterium]